MYTWFEERYSCTSVGKHGPGREDRRRRLSPIAELLLRRSMVGVRGDAGVDGGCHPLGVAVEPKLGRWTVGRI